MVFLLLVLVEEMCEVLIETDFEEGLFEECAFNGLIMLEMDVFPDDVGKSRRPRVRVYVLKFLLHSNYLKQSVKIYLILLHH